MWALLGGGCHSVCHISITCPVMVSRWLLHLQISRLYSRGEGRSRFPGLHQLGLCPFLSGKQKLSQKCPGLFLASNGSELCHWLRLAAREAGKVHSWEKVGIKDSGKHTCSVCHSPLPTLLSLFQQIFPGRAPGGRKWWLSGHGFKAF